MPGAGFRSVSQPAEPSGAHPVPHVSLETAPFSASRRVRCGHHFMVFTGNVSASIKPHFRELSGRAGRGRPTEGLSLSAPRNPPGTGASAASPMPRG